MSKQVNTRGHEGEYVAIPGYFAEVTETGCVRSVPRVVVRSNGRPYTLAGKVLSPAWNGGHWQVPVYEISGVKRRCYVHRLMLLALVGPPPAAEYRALHYDDNPHNNVLANLYWGTMSENAFDRVRNGNDVGARKTHCLRGHPLEGANLTPWRRKGHRGCLACNRAKSQAKYRGYSHDEVRVQVLADEKYALIRAEEVMPICAVSK